MSAAELITEYQKADFSIGYLAYGAGVKGKILEAMENSTVVLGNDIGFAGIDCDALVPFQSDVELIEQIKVFLDAEHYNRATKKYGKFLTEDYSSDLIEIEIKKGLNTVSVGDLNDVRTDNL